MINFKRLYNSIESYKEAGFYPIDTPWIVPTEISNSTSPVKNDGELKHLDGYSLVGSAEQSFIYSYSIKHLVRGKFQSITPCFRLSEVEDYTHQKWFMKNELFICGKELVSDSNLEKVIVNCSRFFENELKKFNLDHLLNEVETNEGFDLYLGSIEIGSYGIRTTEYGDFIYGTGLAEPRFSKAINMLLD